MLLKSKLSAGDRVDFAIYYINEKLKVKITKDTALSKPKVYKGKLSFNVDTGEKSLSEQNLKGGAYSQLKRYEKLYKAIIAVEPNGYSRVNLSLDISEVERWHSILYKEQQMNK